MEAGYAQELSQTLALSNHYLQRLMEAHGLEGIVSSHGGILSLLFERGEVSMSELAAFTQRDPSTVTALVKKLVAMGLVKTRRCPTDRRSVVVALTPQGEGVRADFDAISMRLMAPWRDGVDPEELAVAMRVLATVRANLQAEIDAMADKAEGDARLEGCA